MVLMLWHVMPMETVLWPMRDKQQAKNALISSCSMVARMSALSLQLLPIYPKRILIRTTAVQGSSEQFSSSPPSTAFY